MRRREPEALGTFFDLYAGRIYGLVHHLLGERTASEDAVQEVFLKVHRAIDRLDPERDPVPWLMTIATNVCRDLWRSSGDRMARKSASFEEHPGLANRLRDRGATPEEEAERADRAARVRQAIAALPLAQREVVILHDYEGLTHEEIAGLVGSTHAAVRKRYSRALSALGRWLEEHGA